MLPLRVHSENQRISHIVSFLDTVVDDSDVLLQNLYANQVVLLASGYVENSTLLILSEYAARHSNEAILRYVDHTVKRNNSLNCEKIEKILNCFDNSWWGDIVSLTSYEYIESVDSLKTLRDQIAHGKHNGTGYNVVKKYFNNSKLFVSDMSTIIVPQE